MTSMYLSYGEVMDRHTDFVCNEEFATFLAEELTVWIDNLTGKQNTFILCGLSLSGLAVAHAATKYPGIFNRILCQSPSAWWNDEWLATQLDGKDLSAVRCWLSVGDQETSENVTHAPTAMFQRTSQYESCQRLAHALVQAGATVNENHYPGGHDPACWSTELSDALRWLLNRGGLI